MKKDSILSTIQNFVFILVVLALVSSFVSILHKPDFDSIIDFPTFDNGKNEDETDKGSCIYVNGEIVSVEGHIGSWKTQNAYFSCYECNVCGTVARRENNVVIDFENGAIVDTNGKLIVTVGGAKLTGVESPIEIVSGVTNGGNARDKFSLLGDSENKVLQIVGKKDDSYNPSTICINQTDGFHEGTLDEFGGEYLVFEFDIKFDSFEGTNSSKKIFSLGVYDSTGSFALANFNFLNYKIGGTSYAQIKIANDNYINYKPDGETWVTVRAVTKLALDSNGNCVTKLFYKLRDAEGFMNYITYVQKTGSFATVEAVNHKVKLTTGDNDYDYTYCLDNISFIRTNDAKYFE